MNFIHNRAHEFKQVVYHKIISKCWLIVGFEAWQTRLHCRFFVWFHWIYSLVTVLHGVIIQIPFHQHRPHHVNKILQANQLWIEWVVQVCNHRNLSTSVHATQSWWWWLVIIVETLFTIWILNPSVRWYSIWSTFWVNIQMNFLFRLIPPF